MRILVFGKTGQVARELQVLGESVVTALSRAEADLSDPAACAAAITAHAPDAVINAAAYTAVDKAEVEEALATVINGDAPGAMAGECARLGIPFLQVSTDYVFDGSGEIPWKPTDAPVPLNAYGRSKLSGERAIQAAGGQAAILRTSWVFSTHGANFVKTMLRLSETRDRLGIVDDQIGGPTPAGNIAAALLKMADAMVAGRPGGIWHIAGGPYTSWAGFAEWVFHCAGREVTVDRISSADYPTPARRPFNSRLDCASLMSDFALRQPDWKAAARAVVKGLTT
jgi:dTDP-4-dehydrorhamnose reductase